MAYQLSGNLLSLEQLEEILQKRQLLELPTSLSTILPSAGVDNQVGQDVLALDYIVVHAIGYGAEIPEEIVRLALILHAYSLANHKQTEIQLGTLNRLVTFYNRDIFPVILREGSDSAQIAHLILPLLGLGKVKYQGYELHAPDILDIFSWKPLTLYPAEASRLLQGSTFSLAHAAFYLLQIKNTLAWASYLGQVFLQIADAPAGEITEQVNKLQHTYEAAVVAFDNFVQDNSSATHLESLIRTLSAMLAHGHSYFSALANYTAQTFANLITTSEPPATISFEQAMALTTWLQLQVVQIPVTLSSHPDKAFLLQQQNKALATFIPLAEQIIVLAFWSVSQVGKVFNLASENLTLAAYYHSELFVPKEIVTTQLNKVSDFIKTHPPTLSA